MSVTLENNNKYVSIYIVYAYFDTTCEVFLWLDTCDVRRDNVIHMTVNQGYILTLDFIDIQCILNLPVSVVCLLFLPYNKIYVKIFNTSCN